MLMSPHYEGVRFSHGRKLENNAQILKSEKEEKTKVPGFSVIFPWFVYLKQV